MDVYNIKEFTERNIKKKIAENADFVPARVEKVSVAARAICEWVRAVANFTDVNKEINKKKNIVEKMDRELAKANATLA